MRVFAWIRFPFAFFVEPDVEVVVVCDVFIFLQPTMQVYRTAKVLERRAHILVGSWAFDAEF